MILRNKIKKKQWEGKAKEGVGSCLKVTYMGVPFVSPTGPRSSLDCCGSVVHPKAALHPEHLHPLPVSMWEPLVNTTLFVFVSKHTSCFPLSLHLACPASVWTARAL